MTILQRTRTQRTLNTRSVAWWTREIGVIYGDPREYFFSMRDRGWVNGAGYEWKSVLKPTVYSRSRKEKSGGQQKEGRETGEVRSTAHISATRCHWCKWPCESQSSQRDRENPHRHVEDLVAEATEELLKLKMLHLFKNTMGAPGWLSRLRSDSWSQLRSWYQGQEFEPHVGLHPGHEAYF